MAILELLLFNFRNFASKRIIFDEKLTVIIGPNGSGKSNILEAVSLLSAARPMHIEGDIDLVKFGKSEAKVESRVESQSEKKMLTINFQVIDELHIKKSFLVDDLKKRFIDMGSYLSIVIFHPQDLDLVGGSPSLRRHHLDSFLSSLDRDYWRNISAYNKIVVRRNKVLQRIFEGKAKPLELGFWDARLLEHGAYVSKKRQEFFEFLNFVESVGARGPVSLFPPAPSINSGQAVRVYPERSRRAVGSPFTTATPRKNLPVTINKSLEGFSWDLKQSLVTEEKLLRNRERDITARVTLSGPHRDDFRFIFGGKDMAYFGSRGEQRMAVLALKLAELEYFRTKRGVKPILALDDIFSELDWEHREAVLAVIGNQQTIITAAERESVPKNLLKKAKVVGL
ncbi:hypothetical protein A3A60_04400 [Candidatus Curtissbacteria bacterium RIFCSPLOWO2_01_FULL_42_26]|uniref:DNA replication and repair protein RecF n=1 Tax=Candidatus Curtissbacteria bacterium RIFCSPLOWO2_01_FULL_42_26 TaxID=1797729 RepID=A0A1F5HVW1_9BACT|nr:MAG: hypothetical protein A3A60_04400 [Candidatus Curtissbacteria bacterium RIFCSPLOWO2_01_FULL_42_26]